MGSLPRYPFPPTGPDKEACYTGRQEFLWTMLVVALVSLLMVGMATSTTVVVTFQEENYLVQGGCPSNEPEIFGFARVEREWLGSPLFDNDGAVNFGLGVRAFV